MQKATIRIPVYRQPGEGDPAGDAVPVYAFGPVPGAEPAEDGGPLPVEGELVGYVEVPEGSEVKETYGAAPALFLATSALGIDAEEAISLARDRCYGMNWYDPE